MLRTVCLSLILAVCGFAETITLDASSRTEVIHGALDKLNASYVYPELAKKMEASVREREQRGDYAAITAPAALAGALTSDLQAVSGDKHLRVVYRSEPASRRGDGGMDHNRMRAMMTLQNFGFEKAERLPGNVGYLDLRGFPPREVAEATAAAAMNFLANTDALIIDLRKNGGGEPNMVAFLCSYLFGGERVHLNDLYWRPGNRTDEFWTDPKVPGVRYGNKPVYLLTSHRTFSAAEEFAYDLQNLKRATIVGEVTGGGAHPGGPERINDHFEIWIPTGRAINPVTKTDWEGVGVKPEVSVPQAEALKVAHAAALRKLIADATDPLRRSALSAALDTVDK
jgi:hypothetical protein